MTVSCELWHDRLGHPGKTASERMDRVWTEKLCVKEFQYL
jgi:hypothetical protein